MHILITPYCLKFTFVILLLEIAVVSGFIFLFYLYYMSLVKSGFAQTFLLSGMFFLPPCVTSTLSSQFKIYCIPGYSQTKFEGPASLAINYSIVLVYQSDHHLHWCWQKTGFYPFMINQMTRLRHFCTNIFSHRPPCFIIILLFFKHNISN